MALEQVLVCDMTKGCAAPVTHVDEKGYVYCTTHGQQRRSGGIRCRKLTAAERRKLESGRTISY